MLKTGTTTRFPDLPVGSRYGIVDIKDVVDVQNRAQMRAYANAAINVESLPYSLIISPRTERIAGKVVDATRESKGGIFEFDAVAGTFRTIEFPSVRGTPVVIPR